jgi:hypothetical protein
MTEQPQPAAGMRGLARVFRATPRTGAKQELIAKFEISSADLVKSKLGLLAYSIYEPADRDNAGVIFESVWRDLEDVKRAFGEHWREPHLPDGYAAIIDRCSVEHYEVRSNCLGQTKLK